jgi:GPI mannosyltransferase 3
MVLGGTPVLLVFEWADYVVWGSPFHSFYQAFWVNVAQSKASTYGVEPDYWYIQKLYYLWAGASPLIVSLIAIRGRNSLTWIGVALSIIVSHSLIPHKEYRFIYPASAIFLIVAALGSADVIGKLQAKMGDGIARYLAICGIAFWLFTSLSLAFAPGFSDNWFRSRQLLESALWLNGQPGLCGLLIYDDSWARTGGYTYLHRNIPMYNPLLFREAARRNTAAFNYIILNRSSIGDFQPEFSEARCLGGGAPADVCVIWRQGLCVRNPGMRPLLEQSRLGEVHVW